MKSISFKKLEASKRRGELSNNNWNIQIVISHHRPRLQTKSRTVNYCNLSYLKPMQWPNPYDHKVRFAVSNGQSINNKSLIICDIIVSNHLDMLTVTETWLGSGVNTSTADILNSLNDFTVWQVPRVTGRGGGITLFVRNTFTITRETNVVFKSFEYIDLFVTYRNLVPG